jgi:DNA-binding NarL/FixJ family response regulator
MAADRIRVFIAGNIYVKRALVRRFLEDDGYEVVGEARDREDMVAAVRRDQPDAVVVDDELLVDGPGGGTMGRLRRAAPDARVVVFTNAPTDAAATPEGADGYLEKGLGLASLTAMLGRLFAHDAPITGPAAVEAALADTVDLERDASFADEDERELVGVGAVALGSELALADDGSVADASSDAPPAPPAAPAYAGAHAGRDRSDRRDRPWRRHGRVGTGRDDRERGR